MKVTALGSIVDGKLWFDHGPWFKAQLRQLGDQRVVVEVRPEGTPQGDAFRNWYWAEVAPACAAYMREMGDGDATPASAHDALAHKYLALSPCPLTGTPRRRSTSPSVMSAEDFRAFVLDQVLPFLTRDCGLEIADPDPTKRRGYVAR